MGDGRTAGGPAGGGPAEAGIPERRRERLRREYRAFVRTSHPDRGGDPELFAAGLRRWQEALAGGGSGAGGTRGAGDGGAGTGNGGEHRVTGFRRGPWPVRCGRSLAAAVRRRLRTRVR